MIVDILVKVPFFLYKMLSYLPGTAFKKIITLFSPFREARHVNCNSDYICQ